MKRIKIIESVFLTRSVIDVQVLSCASETSIMIIILQYLLLELSLKFDRLSFARRQFVARVAWYKASPADLDNYRETLNAQLRTIRVPFDAILCRNVLCRDCAHIAFL